MRPFASALAVVLLIISASVITLNEYIIALMTVGFPIETLPVKILNALRYGYTPVIASIAVVFLLVNITVFSLIARLSNLPRILGAQD